MPEQSGGNGRREKITVFGSFVVDLMGRAPHLPAPGETVKGNFFKMGPGGKGFNQGVAAHKAGADITLVTKIGPDMLGEIASSTMESLGMERTYLFRSDATGTGTALILVDENTSENEILVTSGACGEIGAAEFEKVKPLISSSRYLLSQLEINLDMIEQAVDFAYENGVCVILNPAPIQPIPDKLLKKVRIVTPNEVEAQILTGIEIDTEDSAVRAAEIFFAKGVEQVIITLGKRGVFVHDGKNHRIVPPPVVEAIDTTGAGDAFNGGLVTALAEGKDLWEAAWFANCVAALSTTQLGTAPAMPDRRAVDELAARR